MATDLIPQQSPSQQLQNLFSKAAPKFGSVLPKHITPERMIRVAMSAWSRTPGLQKCTPMSIVGAVMEASELGLEAGSVLGSAYLVPYRNGKTGNMEAKLIPGYRGLIDLARRSGALLKMEARIVYEEDKFKVTLGTDPKIIHEPTFGDAGAAVAVYGVATFTEGGTQFDVMTIQEIDAIRRRSKASEHGPWTTDYNEMAKKTVIRRLLKYLPLSASLARALEVEDEAEDDLGRAASKVVEMHSATAAFGLAQALPDASFPIDAPAPQTMEDVKKKRGRKTKGELIAEQAKAIADATPDPKPDREPGDDTEEEFQDPGPGENE